MRDPLLLAAVLAPLLIAGCSGTTPGPVDAASGRDTSAAVDAATGIDAATGTDGGSCGVTDLSAIGDDCGSACPSGYVCQPFSGAVLSMSCQIPCDPAGCPCPTGSECNMHSDKTPVPWYQCDLSA